MSTKEEVMQLVEGLSEDELRIVKRMLQGLRAPNESEASAPSTSAEDRRDKARAGLGVLAHLPGSVEDFLREKREEVEREEERYRRRHPEAA